MCQCLIKNWATLDKENIIWYKWKHLNKRGAKNLLTKLILHVQYANDTIYSLNLLINAHKAHIRLQIYIFTKQLKAATAKYQLLS